MNYFAKLSGKEQKMCYFLLFLACVQFLVGSYDGFARYTSAPMWDSWDGMIGFIVSDSYKSFSGWFSQHNEHRIVLTRAIFWLNYALFNAENWPLIIFNYILAGLSFLLFYRIIKQCFCKNIGQNEIFAKNYIIFLSFIVLFSKIQAENFDWEFQSQFFLAFLLPLFSLYLLGKSSLIKENSAGIFTVSCVFGILSAGTMANGVFALPAMVFLGFLLRMNLHRILILSLLSITLFSLYLHNYQTPSNHSSFESLKQPFDVFLYIISYYGAIFKFLFGKIGCRIFGILFLILLTINLLKILKKEEKSWINIMLISFICYIALTGLISAIGRVGSFGVNQAYSGRYSTPVIMAWVSFLIIYKDLLAEFLNKSDRNKYIALILPLSLVINQIDRLDNKKNPDAAFEKNISVLSLEMDVRDEKQVIYNKKGGSLHFSINTLNNLTKTSSEKNISIFGHPLIKDVKEKIGEKINDDFCEFEVKSTIATEKIDENNKFYRISGEIFAEDNAEESFYLTNDKKITGYVILNNGKTKFKGYNIGKKNIYLYDLNKKCRFKNGK